jgi:predicted outer membrane repeat protein
MVAGCGRASGKVAARSFVLVRGCDRHAVDKEGVMTRLRLLVGAAVICLTATAQSATIRVPSDEPTIQAGVTAAVEGDTVLVEPGIYYESVSMLGKGITLRSEDGAMSTVIRATGSQRAVLCGGGENADTRIEGFTLRDASVAGVECVLGASPILSDLILAGNIGSGARSVSAGPTFRMCRFYGNGGPGVDCSGGTVIVKSCEFTAPGQSGIKVLGHAVLLVEDSVFVGFIESTGDRLRDSGIRVESSSFTMTRCSLEGFDGYSALSFLKADDIVIEDTVFRGNSSELGGAIYCEGHDQTDSPIAVIGCTFEDNTASENGGACVLRWCRSALFDGCAFTDNTTPGLGGAVSTHDVAQVTYAGCTFSGNHAGHDGGAARGYGPTSCVFVMRGCLLVDNGATVAGGAIRISSCSGSIEHNTIYGCSSGGDAGAIHIGGSPSPDITACIVCGCTGTGIATVDDVALPFVSYCDVYDCTQGNYGGLLPELTGYYWNKSADPMFCDPAALDFHIDTSSPCRGAGPGGSDIGAFGVGCGASVVKARSWGAIKAMFR